MKVFRVWTDDGNRFAIVIAKDAAEAKAVVLSEPDEVVIDVEVLGDPTRGNARVLLWSE